MTHPEIHPTNANGLAWSSWLAPLLACYGSSGKKSIIEVGMGHFSTPALHNLAIASGGVLVSVESHAGWSGGFRGYPGSHHVICGPYRASVGSAKAYGPFAVGLIDESPPLGPDGRETSCGERRLDTLFQLQDICDYLVVHDYWNDIRDRIDPFLKTFGWRWHVCNDYDPPALVASKTLPVPEVLL